MLEKYMKKYIDSSRNTLKAMFNLDVNLISNESEITIAKRFTPTKNLTVQIPFFGNIAGDFFISVDELEWTEIIEKTIGTRDIELVYSSLNEFLNIVVGDTITAIIDDFPNLTYLSPRIIKGQMNYPAVKTVVSKIGISPFTACELGISIDMMKIDINEELQMAKNEASFQKSASERMGVLSSMVENILLDLRNPVNHLGEGLTHLGELPYQEEISQKELIDLIKDMNSSLVRIKNIAGSLVNFSKATHAEIEDFNLKDCLLKAIKLSNFTYPNQIEIEINAEPIEIHKSSPSQVEQVIFNLLINAFDALDGVSDPKVKICTFSEESYNGFKISYNGREIDETTQQKMWEPLFSRNKSGNITCLGLTVCREIMQMFGGDLYNDYDDGNYTFSVILPVHKSAKA